MDSILEIICVIALMAVNLAQSKGLILGHSLIIGSLVHTYLAGLIAVFNCWSRSSRSNGLIIASLFVHLFTHAFFKGLLFLSSGVVIHSIDGVLKTYRLGGLNKLLSIGHGLMVSGSLALVGLPFLAGFYSKELIIICSFSTYL